MNRCIICHFEPDLDDVAVSIAGGRWLICVRCINREAHDEKPMPPRLRREVEAVMKD